MTDGNTANDTHASKPDPVTPGERAAFERDGYHLLRPLFTAAEAAEWRNRINHVFEFPAEPNATPQIAGATHTRADGVTTNDDFWPVIFNERLLASVRALIGDDIRYTQHSDLHINLPGGRWHRDSACRDFGVGADWDESEVPYRVVRVAIYLSDHTQSNSSLVVLPGSHRHESRLRRAEYVFWNKIRSFLRRRGKNDWLPHWFLSGPRRVVRTQPGDCVIFDQRLLHAGGVIGGAEPKYAIYLSFGIDNQHSRNHREFFLNRPTYNPHLPDALRARLKDHGLLLEDSAVTTHS